MKLKYFITSLVFVTAGLMAAVSQAGSMTGITAPASAVQGTPVTITVQGTGSCVGYNVNWGDSTSTPVGGGVSFPHSPPAHTYTSTGTKTISVSPVGGLCSGTPSTTINITSAPAASISSITGNSCAVKGSSYKIKVNGTGVCSTLNVTWGDTNSNSYAGHNLAASPWRSHTYTTLGSKTINATGTGCAGSASKTVIVKDSCSSGPGGFALPGHLRWILRVQWPIKWNPPGPKGPGPVCLSCPNWLEKIRVQEKYQHGLVRQLKKYQGMAKGGKRLSKGQMRHMQQLRKNLQRSEGQHQRLIGSYRRAFNKRGVMKKGVVPRRNMQQRHMAPGMKYK